MLDSIFSKLTAEEGTYLRELLGDAATRALARAKLDWRNQAIVNLVAQHYGGYPSDRARAGAVARDLQRLSSTRAASSRGLLARNLDDRHGALMRVLELSAGRPPGERHVAKILTRSRT